LATVKVLLPTVLARLSGRPELTVEASTVIEALRELAKLYGDELRSRLFEGEGKVNRRLNIYVNGRNVRFLEGLNTRLNDGDTVSIIPAVSGG